MPTSRRLYKNCKECLGDGKVTVPPFVYIDEQGNHHTSTEQDCARCDGTGMIEWGQDKDSISKCPTSLILENINSNEYTALTADQKTIFNIYISAGTLDMSAGTRAYGIFLEWFFPSGTASYTAITAALANL